MQSNAVATSAAAELPASATGSSSTTSEWESTSGADADTKESGAEHRRRAPVGGKDADKWVATCQGAAAAATGPADRGRARSCRHNREEPGYMPRFKPSPRGRRSERSSQEPGCHLLWFSLVDVKCSDAPLLSLDPDVQSIPLPRSCPPAPALPLPRARCSPMDVPLPMLLCTYHIHASLRFVVMMYPGCMLSLALF